MLYFCSHCDINYFPKFKALMRSLESTLNEDFIMFLLCNDEETYIESEGVRNVRSFSLKSYEQSDTGLQRAMNNPASKYGSQRDNYMWSLTPWWITKVLSMVPWDEKLMYCDSDIFFYESPKIILDTVGKRVGIHTHRFTKPYSPTHHTGWYNVGVMVFPCNIEGLKIADLWWSWTSDTSSEYYSTHGSCGDQKYLELFHLFTDVSVFDEEWGCYVHMAPWCAQNPDNYPVVFYHFSHFVFLGDEGWKDAIKREWHPTRDPYIRKFYEEYYKTLLSL